MADKKTTGYSLVIGIDYIGVTCVFYCHDGQGNLLMHKRSSACRDEQGVWDVGGGSMEHGETFEEAVRREVQEEYGAEIEELEFVTLQNVLRENKDQKTHWIALIFCGKVSPKQAKINNPLKMDQIGWFPLDNLPSPIHPMLPSTLDLIREKGLL